jgi:ribose/xylose/arabinose/galactoside ABC-type transport system permease subunit
LLISTEPVVSTNTPEDLCDLNRIKQSVNTEPRRVLLGVLFAVLGTALNGFSWMYDAVTPFGLALSLLLVLLGIAYIWSDGTISEELGISLSQR